MRVIIIGCGRMGSGLAQLMSLQGHVVTVVDSGRTHSGAEQLYRVEAVVHETELRVTELLNVQTKNGGRG